MGKYLRISSYIRKPFLTYDFATAPLWISLYMRKIRFSFFQCSGIRCKLMRSDSFCMYYCIPIVCNSICMLDRRAKHHKVLTYIEYRAVSGVFRTIDPPPPLHPASVSSPAPKAGGYTLVERWGGGGSIFRKTPDIKLASYSIIPLRAKLSHVKSKTPSIEICWCTANNFRYMYSKQDLAKPHSQIN
jgi:hypothetical protein